MQNYLSIGLFGLLGIFCRYGIDKHMASMNQIFPTSTFVINILGCFLAGLIYAVGERQGFSLPIQTGLLVGFCGGFTTFSAYALQTFIMLENGHFLPAIIYIAISPVLGVLAALISVFGVRKILV